MGIASANEDGSRMKKNQDFVAIDHRIEAGWHLTIPIDSVTVLSAHDEFIGNCRRIFEIFEGLLRPTHVRIWMKLLPEDVPLSNYIDELGTGDRPTEVRELVDESGITFDRIQSVIDDVAEEDGCPILGGIRFKEAATRITLEEWEGYISKTSDRAELWSHTEESILDGEIYTDPLEARIELYEPYIDPPSSSLRITTHTNIWAEDSEIGRVNRERIEGAFESLVDELAGAEVEFNCRYSHLWS